MADKRPKGLKAAWERRQTRTNIGRKYGSSEIDYSILFVTLLLLGVGLVMIYSTSYYKAGVDSVDSAYYLRRQAINVGIGLAGMLAAAKLDYRIYKSKRPFFQLYYLGTLLLLALTLVLAKVKNGSKRWLVVGGFSFQPSEMAKLMIILMLAMFISNRLYMMKDTWGVLKTFALMLPIFAIVGVENLSTCFVLLAITIGILYVASKKKLPFVILGMIAAGFIAALVAYKPYRLERIKGLFDPDHQTLQGLYAIGSGGFFGKGLGQGMQKMGFVPETHNDMIFSIICEELGLFGAICIILLYAVLIWRLAVLAINAADLFGSMIVTGVMTHIGIQTFINIGVVTNIVPNTGVPLPFISYGGTSIIILLVEMGIVLSVSKQVRKR